MARAFTSTAWPMSSRTSLTRYFPGVIPSAPARRAIRANRCGATERMIFGIGLSSATASAESAGSPSPSEDGLLWSKGVGVG